MRVTLARRVRTLEAGSVDHTKPITLFFADGRKVIWPDGERRWRRLYRGVCAPKELNPQDAADLELVRTCVGSQEPSGAQMLIILNAVLNSPVAPDDDTIPRRRGTQ
jgi:hypothetical protein